MAIFASTSAAPRVPAGPDSLAAIASAPTRRGLLGAIAALPAASIFGAFAIAPAMAATSEWDAALRRFEVAREHLSRAADANDAALGLYYEAREGLPQGPDGLFRAGDTAEVYNARMSAQRIEAAKADADCQAACGALATKQMLDDACSADDEALQALYAAPAPHLQAAIKKAELINDGYGDGMHHLLVDLRRLVVREG